MEVVVVEERLETLEHLWEGTLVLLDQEVNVKVQWDHKGMLWEEAFLQDQGVFVVDSKCVCGEMCIYC
jgi:hypothetical protein